MTQFHWYVTSIINPTFSGYVLTLPSTSKLKLAITYILYRYSALFTFLAFASGLFVMPFSLTAVF